VSARLPACLAAAAALAALAPAEAAAKPFRHGQCSADVPGDWTVAGDTASAADGSMARLYGAPTPQVVIDSARDSGLAARETNAAFLRFSRDLADGGRQSRSVTRRAPACAVDVIVRSPEGVPEGDTIARSVRG
jgi:hypothetical protein